MKKKYSKFEEPFKVEKISKEQYERILKERKEKNEINKRSDR